MKTNKQLVKSRRRDTPVLDKAKQNRLAIARDVNMLNEVNTLFDK